MDDDLQNDMVGELRSEGSDERKIERQEEK